MHGCGADGRGARRPPGSPGAEAQLVEVDGVGQHLLSGVVEVDVVARVVGGQDPGRIRGVADGGVEVDDRVEDRCGPQQPVHGLPGRLTGLGVAGEALVGRDGAADDLQPPGVRTADQLAVAPHEGLWVELFRGALDVVDTDQEDHRAHPGAGERVGVEAGEDAGADVVAEQPVPGDPGVEDAEPAVRGQRPQPGGEPVGPAAVGVAGGAGAVGERVADGDDAARGAGAEDVDAAEVVPGARGGGVGGAALVGGVVAARGEEVGLERGAVLGRLAGFIGCVERDQQIGGGGYAQRYRVREQVPPRRYGDRPPAGLRTGRA